MTWHYIKNGQQHGPISDEEFKEQVRRGVVLDTTWVWCEGWPEWMPYGQRSGASSEAPSPQAPPAAPPAPPPRPMAGPVGNQNKNFLIIAAVLGGLILVYSMSRGGGDDEYARRGKTSEAIDNLDKIYKGAAFYYSGPRINMDGSKLPCQFPAPTRTCVPEGSPCDHPDNRYPLQPEAWTGATWSALSFQIYDSHYFKYCFDSSGVLAKARFTASAHADLDCDGTWSTFQRLGFGDPQSTRSECSLQGSAAFSVDNETE